MNISGAIVTGLLIVIILMIGYCLGYWQARREVKKAIKELAVPKLDFDSENVKRAWQVILTNTQKAWYDAMIKGKLPEQNNQTPTRRTL